MTPADDTDQEKRITFQLYNHWFDLTGECNIPPLRSLVPKNITPYKNNIVLIDLRDPGDKPTIQVVGQLLIQDIAPKLVLKNITDIPHRTLLSRMTDHYREVLANKSPISFEAEFKNISEERLLYRCILLPFSDDNENINFIMGAIRWITVKDRKNTRSLPTSENTTGVTIAHLQDHLETCRHILRGGNSIKIRSRRSLYDALGSILDFHILCRSSPDSYHQLLVAEGLKIQQRALFTPTLKLCFGRTYDKTRLTEYATALSFAQDKGMDGTSLPNFLSQFPGGIKGCVRVARGQENNSPRTQPKKNTLKKYHGFSRNMPALARFDRPPIDKDNSEEFCLLMARRTGLHIEVIKIVENDEKILEPIFKLLVEDP